MFSEYAVLCDGFVFWRSTLETDLKRVITLTLTLWWTVKQGGNMRRNIERYRWRE